MQLWSAENAGVVVVLAGAVILALNCIDNDDDSDEESRQEAEKR